MPDLLADVLVLPCDACDRLVAAPHAHKPTPEETKAAKARYMREWRLRDLEGNRRKSREGNARYRARKRAEDPAWRPARTTKPHNPVVHRVGEAINRAIKSGRLVRPDVCEQCGGGGPIEAAHEDYADRWRIKWLCRSCHRVWDYHAPKAGVDVPPLVSPKGEAHPRARLTEQDVAHIRSSSASRREMASRFGVSMATIKAVRTRHTWRHCA